VRSKNPILVNLLSTYIRLQRLDSSEEAQHDVNVVIEVPEKGRAVQFGRYNQGGEMNIFGNKQYIKDAYC